ncbi:MAG: hypothetical protein H6722_12370 [Sandaracinus sp.]|nr:hypothetical protein [Sandaracinus sp.]MCB9613241.1 hypothetical protein [Sandaracinus sp.]
MLRAMKQLGLFFFFGAPIGATITSFVAPWFIKAFHVPMSESSALCNCAELADNMLTSFWHAQIGGTIAGGVAGIALWVVLRRKGKLKGPAKEAKPEAEASKPTEATKPPETPPAA